MEQNNNGQTQDARETWLCLHCKFPLGNMFPEAEGNFMRIKTKGGVVDFIGGMISAICSKCSGTNVLIDEDYAKLKNLAMQRVIMVKNYRPPVYDNHRRNNI